MDTGRLLLQTPHGAQWGSRPVTIAAATAAYSLLFAALERTGALLPRRRLSRKDRLDWNSRVVSTVNALVLVWGAGGGRTCVPCLVSALAPAPRSPT